jgi:hypothetical protein
VTKGVLEALGSTIPTESEAMDEGGDGDTPSMAEDVRKEDGDGNRPSSGFAK